MLLELLLLEACMQTKKIMCKEKTNVQELTTNGTGASKKSSMSLGKTYNQIIKI